jgi:hypothetical protein
MMRRSSRMQFSQRKVTSSAYCTDADSSAVIARIGVPHFGQGRLRRAMACFLMRPRFAPIADH